MFLLLTGADHHITLVHWQIKPKIRIKFGYEVRAKSIVASVK